MKKIKKLLNRSNKSMKRTFEGKDILVTGGCGSIGTEIVKQLLNYNPKRVKIFDNNESSLFYLQQELKSEKIRILVGDIRDKDRLRFAVHGSEIVFHAAALKHVPLCEYNPFEAVCTNVLGTQNLIEVARLENVKKVISISTDKAVNPINTMGATKLLAEKLILTGELGDNCVTRFSCVRFGNVLNSAGSVIPIFRKQIKNGRPVTITSDEMVRFFMSMQQAVSLVLRTAHFMKGKEIFILKMKKLRIKDLAEVMIEKMKSNTKIITMGIRKGEKIDEALVTEEEEEYLLDAGHFYILKQNINSQKLKRNPNFGELLTKNEISHLLDKYQLCN
jgi:UDP-N-acetylglucosamine 4,6-dehydratase/5-epimerase